MAALFMQFFVKKELYVERSGKVSCNLFRYVLQYYYPTNGRPNMVTFTVQYGYYYYFFLDKE